MDPATITAIAKVAATALTDEKLRKTVGWIIAAILSPVILIIVVICSLLSGTADHNNNAVDLCFNGGVIAGAVPENYRSHIEDMRYSFTLLDGSIATINSETENGNSLDLIRVKAIFYALYFAQTRSVDTPSRTDHNQFAECFVRYEKRTRTVTDENGNETEETYTVAVPVSLSEAYANISAQLGRAVTAEDEANASAIYNLVLFGNATPNGYEIDFEDWQNGTYDTPPIFVGEGEFASPLGSNWRNMVTSEFGWRPNPFGGGGGEGHSGLDMGAGKGFPIQVARDGVVSYVKNSGSAGYGYHIVIDHGDGMVTLYAHCSKVYAKSGQAVLQGDVIAAVGTTGRSTGNHLHFEVRVNGKTVNPRLYMP